MSEGGWLPRLGFPVCLRKHRARQLGVTPLLMAAMLEKIICYGKHEESVFVAVCNRLCPCWVVVVFVGVNSVISFC